MSTYFRCDTLPLTVMTQPRSGSGGPVFSKTYRSLQSKRVSINPKPLPPAHIICIHIDVSLFEKPLFEACLKGSHKYPPVLGGGRWEPLCPILPQSLKPMNLNPRRKQGRVANTQTVPCRELPGGMGLVAVPVPLRHARSNAVSRMESKIMCLCACVRVCDGVGVCVCA